ncbi:MAG: BtpA/SgcQ family protein [Erysipelotrichaceae bacterium]|jgi:membrane complex biogenesis BtpA family protein|nr:BtpA/SgcQ family protein [Erysipelotrichaceae bacterium]
MWLKETFGTDKPIIAMLHLLPLPGDHKYDVAGGIDKVLKRAKSDLLALQDGGVDSVLICNEYSLPYKFNVDTCTVAAMASIIGQLKKDIKVPFGVHVAADECKTYDLAVAVGASFVRGTYTGAYAGDFGIADYKIGDLVRHKHNVGADDIRTLFILIPEAAKYLVDRDIADLVKSNLFYGQPDALLVSGLVAGHEVDTQIMSKVKNVAEDCPVFANNGVKLENVKEQLAIADGAIVGTTFKYDGKFYNEVDPARVKAFMDLVKSFRKV